MASSYEILASQYFDLDQSLIYSMCFSDTPLLYTLYLNYDVYPASTYYAKLQMVPHKTMYLSSIYSNFPQKVSVKQFMIAAGMTH